MVTPVVGVVPPDLPLEPHEQRSPTCSKRRSHYLLDPANQHRRSALFQGRERHYYEIVWNGRRIWGATAAMIVNLSRQAAVALKIDAAKWRRRRGMERLLDALGADEGADALRRRRVRDDLLDLPVSDVDLATRLQPDEVDAAARRGADQGGADRDRPRHDHRGQRRPPVSR